MPTRNVNLTEHFNKFIESGISSGRFSNASEVVREGLRLLEQQEKEDKAKLEWLRKAAKRGFDAGDRGEYTVLRSRDGLHSFMMEIHEQVAAEITAERKREIGGVIHDARDLRRHLPKSNLRQKPPFAFQPVTTNLQKISSPTR